MSSLIKINMRIWFEIFDSANDGFSEGGDGDDESFDDV